MKPTLASGVLDQLFYNARSQRAWLDSPVSEDQIHTLYQLLRQGPTSHNGCPGRFVFVRSQEGREWLCRAVQGHNAEMVRSAPVTVIVGYDTRFHDHLPKLFRAYDANAYYEQDESNRLDSALRNSSLQGAYLMLAARALGLDCGPMSGFDADVVDQTFFRDSTWRSNFLCCLGEGDASRLLDTGPRLAWEEACRFA